MQVEVVDYQDPQAAAKFTQALKEIGFAVISNHPINNDLINQVYAAWGQFFNSNEKDQYAFDPKTHDGFISTELSETAKGNSVKDIKEFYHYYHPWGRCPESLKKVTDELVIDLTNLAKQLLQWVQDNTPDEVRNKFSMPLPKMLEGKSKSLFRLIHYPPLTGNEQPGAIRAADHEDINLLTLLPAATAKGLQVKNKEDEWLDVPCNPGWIIVNIADMLQECSGHYYPSTTHRVINPEGGDAKKSRLSMPLFLHPADGVVLSDRHTSDSYRAERYSEIGLD